MAHIGPMLIVGLVLDTPSSTGYQIINLREGSLAAQRAEREVQKVLVTCESLPAHN
jgi:hypothetical protein